MGYKMSKLELDSNMCDNDTSSSGSCTFQRRRGESFEIDGEIAHVTKLRSEPNEKLHKTMNSEKRMPISVVKMLSAREANFSKTGNFSLADRSYVLGRYLPVNGPCCIDRMNSRAYVSQFSADGSLFVAGFQVSSWIPNDFFSESSQRGYSCWNQILYLVYKDLTIPSTYFIVFLIKISNQGSHIRIYDADNGWRVKKDILARSLRWTITDTSLSSNQHYLVGYLQIKLYGISWNQLPIKSL